jgi:hypothetical protein
MTDDRRNLESDFSSIYDNKKQEWNIDTNEKGGNVKYIACAACALR